MTPPFSIHVSHLRSIEAGVYERGAAYARDGRVRECAVVDGALEGAVAGGALYRVWVAARGDGLVADCTCPSPDAIC